MCMHNNVVVSVYKSSSVSLHSAFYPSRDSVEYLLNMFTYLLHIHCGVVTGHSPVAISRYPKKLFQVISSHSSCNLADIFGQFCVHVDSKYSYIE